MLALATVGAREVRIIDVGKGREVLAHAAGMTERNFMRLLPGDKVEIELAAQDQTRGRILKKL